MEYFEVPPPKTGGSCSDDQCPCDDTHLPRGEGFLYIPTECCDFRWDCRSVTDLEAKARRLSESSNQFIVFGHGITGPILLCRSAADRRFLDMKIAAADAKRWWETGQVPFRPTPRRGEFPVEFTKAAAAGPGCAVLLLGVLGASAAGLLLLVRALP